MKRVGAAIRTTVWENRVIKKEYLSRIIFVCVVHVLIAVVFRLNMWNFTHI